MLVARKIIGSTPDTHHFAPEDFVLALDVWATKKPKVPKSKTVSDSRMRKATDEVEFYMRSGEWSPASPLHFVALYTHLHESVYGATPVELGPSERFFALAAANRMLDKQFDGDSAAMADFMRWTWTREKGREKWRRDNDRSGARIGWKLQFNGSLLTDHRVDLARTRGRK